MYDQYYAFVGTSQGKPGDGVSVDVATTREVNLGSTSPAGAPKPGTTLQMTVTDGAPDFSHSPLPDGSFVKAFEIKTGPDFTVKEASKSSSPASASGWAGRSGWLVDAGHLTSLIYRADGRLQTTT